MAGRRDDAKYNARRNAILDAATLSFRTKGYQNARLEDVAEVVGITKASVYYYFPKKSDLLIEICRRAMELSLDRQERIIALDLDAAERLRQAVSDHIHGMAANVSIWSIFFRELELELADDPRRAELNSRLRTFGNHFRELLDEGVSEGLFRPLDTRLASNAILGMLNWSNRWIGTEDVEQVVDTMVSFIDNGLLTEKAAAKPAKRKRRSSTKASS